MFKAVNVVMNTPHTCALLCDCSMLSPVRSSSPPLVLSRACEGGRVHSLPSSVVDRDTGWRILTTASTILDAQETEGCWENPGE